ncbi:MAG: glycine cleavage T C-terminal barrel domain-containing protein, partial [Methanobacteriota archaeon]
KKFRCVPLPSLGPRDFASRTGYTGEDGFELFLPNAEGVRLFPKILEAGREDGAAPCGLGARDTLRLEMGYCLAGHEFEGGRTPLEAGLDRLVDWDHEFSGRKALEAQRAAGDHDRLVGVRLDVRGIPRQGDPVEVSGRRVGTVTSGTLSPTLREGIALAYVRPPHADVDAAVSILIRGRPQPARVVSLPFVRSSS